MDFRNGKAKIQAAGAEKVRAWVVAGKGGGETLQPMGWGVRGCWAQVAPGPGDLCAMSSSTVMGLDGTLVFIHCSRL